MEKLSPNTIIQDGAQYLDGDGVVLGQGCGEKFHVLTHCLPPFLYCWLFRQQELLLEAGFAACC